MMSKLLVTLMTLLCAMVAFGQGSDPILGKWQNPGGDGRIEIYKKGELYFGRLYWVKDAAKKDVNNPDETLRSRNIQGLEILKDFKKSGTVYEKGEIYDPKSGKTYSCKMTPKGNDKLDIRGFVGFSLLGRTETWKRIE